MTRGQRIATLVQIELARRIRSWRSWSALCLGISLLALGAWNYWHALPPRPEDDRLFGYAYLLALLVALNLGIARDRRARFDSFLANNFLSAFETYASRILAALMYMALVNVSAFLLALGTSLGNIEYAAWYALLFFLIALMFLPCVVLVELLLDIEYPIAIVALVFTAVISIVNRSGGAKGMLHMLALDVARYDYAGLTRLAPRAGLALLFTAVLYPLYLWRLEPRCRPVLQKPGAPALASTHEPSLPPRKGLAG